MDNRTLAQRLASMAHTLEKKQASLFRIRAYRRAAETILGLERPVSELVDHGGRRELADLPGIGKSLSRTIEEWMRDEVEAEGSGKRQTSERNAHDFGDKSAQLTCCPEEHPVVQ